MNNNILIITKPFQLVNALNIPIEGNIKILVIPFANSDNIIAILRKKYPEIEVDTYSNKNLSLIYCILNQFKISNLYMDSDFGLIVRFLLLLLPFVNCYLYEEGYANYTSLRSPNNIRNRFLIKFQNLFNIKNYNGGSCRIKGIYLYDKKLFNNTFKDNKVKLLDFKKNFKENILECKLLLHYNSIISFDHYQNKKLLIYLSSWNVSVEALNILSSNQYKDYIKILKPHPNITDNSVFKDFNTDYTIPPDLIFEFFLLNVLEFAEKITVIHHGSFAMHYINEKTCLKISEIVI